MKNASQLLSLVTYHDNGNIDTKPGVGTYCTKPVRVPTPLTGIADGTAGAGVESGIMQEIGYTAFNKVSHVQHQCSTTAATTTATRYATDWTASASRAPTT